MCRLVARARDDCAPKNVLEPRREPGQDGFSAPGRDGFEALLSAKTRAKTRAKVPSIVPAAVALHLRGIGFVS